MIKDDQRWSKIYSPILFWDWASSREGPHKMYQDVMFFGLWRQQQLVANWKAKVVTADEHAKFVNDPWSGPCNLLHLLNSAQKKFNGPHIQLTNARLPAVRHLLSNSSRLSAAYFPWFSLYPCLYFTTCVFLAKKGACTLQHCIGTVVQRISSSASDSLSSFSSASVKDLIWSDP